MLGLCPQAESVQLLQGEGHNSFGVIAESYRVTADMEDCLRTTYNWKGNEASSPLWTLHLQQNAGFIKSLFTGTLTAKLSCSQSFCIVRQEELCL